MAKKKHDDGVSKKARAKAQKDAQKRLKKSAKRALHHAEKAVERAGALAEAQGKKLRKKAAKLEKKLARLTREHDEAQRRVRDAQDRRARLEATSEPAVTSEPLPAAPVAASDDTEAEPLAEPAADSAAEPAAEPAPVHDVQDGSDGASLTPPLPAPEPPAATLVELRAQAKERGIPRYYRLSKPQLIAALAGS